MPTAFGTPEHWHQRALEARDMAKGIKEVDARRAMFDIAENYEKIAKRAEAKAADPAPRRRANAGTMPKGPQGQKRPAEVVGNAVKVMRIATGEEAASAKSAAAELGSLGGKARAASLSKKKRGEIAKKAARARWGKS